MRHLQQGHQSHGRRAAGTAHQEPVLSRHVWVVWSVSAAVSGSVVFVQAGAVNYILEKSYILNYLQLQL